MYTKYILLVLIIYFSPAYAYRNLFIIIHGTWASSTDWHMPGGDFFDALQQTVLQHEGYVVTYAWSGKLDHAQRLQAAQGLKQLIQSYDLTRNIYLIGHSHGSNVAALATQLLGKDMYNKHTITALYMLGTPINAEYYLPDMDIVGHVYNLFSSGDFIQHVFGRYDRELPKHPRIANIRIFINDVEPGHSELHHPVIAKWLPLFPDRLIEQQETGFMFFTCTNPGVLKFYYDAPPKYEIDLRQRFLDLYQEVVRA
ncbi:MAG TPA: hypothetical protein PLU71_04760 [Candidatus Dependentiae bacterium]|nr:hypothetical protein [Candidatus Dependentiae bacterium]HRQ63145.1 hypothetical protein [Candidatus Dependentiae bacterium]